MLLRLDGHRAGRRARAMTCRSPSGSATRPLRSWPRPAPPRARASWPRSRTRDPRPRGARRGAGRGGRGGAPDGPGDAAVDLPALLRDSRESPHWEDVASRCLTCGNCTWSARRASARRTEDVTDLTGDHAERWQRWASCFELDFSYMHGGSVRQSGASRYRQWISHKLGTWHDQFGTSGCVGCGRCIDWCPVGIDITEEVAAPGRAAERGRTADRGRWTRLSSISDCPAFWPRLSPDELAQVSATARRYGSPHGSGCSREGEQAEGCWLIHAGRVALDVPIPGRGLVVVQTLGRRRCARLVVARAAVPLALRRPRDRATPTADRAGHRRGCGPGRRGSAVSAMPCPGRCSRRSPHRLQATRARLLDLYGSR